MLKLFWSLPVFALAGCVTINIYFPAAEAERAADKIIDEVWQLKNAKGDKPKVSPAPATKQSTP